MVKRVLSAGIRAAFAALVVALGACTTPASQPRADTVFGPGASTAMVVISESRLVTLRRVDLEMRATGEEVYEIGATKFGGGNSWLDVREVVPGDYAVHMITGASVMGGYAITCLARAAPVYRLGAGQITVIPVQSSGGAEPQALADFAAARTRYPNLIGEPKVAERVAIVQMAEHAGYLAGCPANRTIVVLD